MQIHVEGQKYWFKLRPHLDQHPFHPRMVPKAKMMGPSCLRQVCRVGL